MPGPNAEYEKPRIRKQLGEKPAFAAATCGDWQAGMTLREYYAAHAPVKPQKWFKPTMSTKRPKTNLLGDGDCEPYRNREEAEQNRGDCFHNANEKDQKAWDAEQAKQRLIQWPSAWADAVIAHLAASD